MRKPAFCICENKDADQLRGVTAKLISAFVFTTRIVQSLYFLNPKFQASSHLLWLYSPVCVGHGRKPRRPVFTQPGSIECAICISDLKMLDCTKFSLTAVKFCHREKIKKIQTIFWQVRFTVSKLLNLCIELYSLKQIFSLIYHYKFWRNAVKSSFVKCNMSI